MLILIFALTIIPLTLLLVYKLQEMEKMQQQVAILNKSLDDMDEQAKLIVRTDMELNKIQEELDKKIAGLYSLQKLSRNISMTLEEEQLFTLIRPENLADLGFEKAFAFLWNNASRQFDLKFSIGYSGEEAEAIKTFVNANKEVLINFISADTTLSSNAARYSLITQQQLNEIFKVNSFILSPLVSQAINKGLLFAGTQNIETVLTEGDEELIKILATQLAQSLENARLFEKTWRSQQELEKKVTERTRELTLAMEELKKMSARKTNFVSSVSHELRTPLTSIKGYAAILLTGKLGELPKEAAERLEKINRHSDELARMVNDLLDISRIESGKVVMKIEICNLQDMADKVGDLLSGQLKERKLYLEIAIDSGANAVLVDRTQIERVLINLIGNAMKFTPADGKISIRSRKVDKMAEVTVADTGCGIPTEAQEAIFDEFYRVDNAINQEVKGTGLGLALVKHIVEAHGGTITVRSTVGAGSNFIFTLPLAP